MASTNLLLGNLSSERVSKRDVFNIFRQYGPLAQISLKSAYGFVQYHTVDDAQGAMQNLQGAEVKGRKIREFRYCSGVVIMTDRLQTSRSLAHRRKRARTEIARPTGEAVVEGETQDETRVRGVPTAQTTGEGVTTAAKAALPHRVRAEMMATAVTVATRNRNTHRAAVLVHHQAMHDTTTRTVAAARVRLTTAAAVTTIRTTTGSHCLDDTAARFLTFSSCCCKK